DDGAGEQAAREHGLPAVRALPAHVGLRQRRLRAEGEGRAAPRPRRADQGDPADRLARRPREAAAAPTLPRAAAAGRAGGRARALVNGRAAVLLDEPLGALDVKLRKQMQLQLKAIQHDVGTTFVYVTHDQEEALAMSDRIAVMNGGTVEQIGSPREIYDQPRTAVVAHFIGSAHPA